MCNNCRIKKLRSIIKKKKKKHAQIVLLAKTKLNTTEVFIINALIDLFISRDEFLVVNNPLREYDDSKEKIKNLKMTAVLQRS